MWWGWRGVRAGYEGDRGAKGRGREGGGPIPRIGIQFGFLRAPPLTGERVCAPAEDRRRAGWGRYACTEPKGSGLRFSLRVRGINAVSRYARTWVRGQCSRLLPGGVEGRARDGRQVRPVRRRVPRGTSPPKPKNGAPSQESTGALIPRSKLSAP